MRRLWTMGMVAGLLIGACSGDDNGDAETNAYAEAVADGLQATDEFPLDDTQSECLGRELVDAIGGPAVFEDAGISPDDLAASDALDLDLEIDPERADDIAATLGTCDISLKDALLDSFGDQVPAEARDCISAAIDDDALADVFAQAFVSDTPQDAMPADLLTALTACVQ